MDLKIKNKIYRRIEVPRLTGGSGVDQNDGDQNKENPDGEHDDLNDWGMGRKKNKPTPANSENLAEAAGRPYLSQWFALDGIDGGLHYKKTTSVMIRVCHSRSRFLSCMYIHDDFMTESI